MFLYVAVPLAAVFSSLDHSIISALFLSLLSNDSVYARIGTVDSGENRIGKNFKMAALYQKRVDIFPKLG